MLNKKIFMGISRVVIVSIIALSSTPMINAHASTGDFYNQTTQTKYTKADLISNTSLADGLQDEMDNGNVILKEYNTGKYIDYSKANTSFLDNIINGIEPSTAVGKAIVAGKTNATKEILEAYGLPTTITVPTIKSVNAINGKVTVTFDKVLTLAPTISDFAIKETIGSTNTTIIPTSVTMDSTMKIATFTMPTLASTATDQSIVYGMSYKSASIVNSIAFTVPKKVITIPTVANVSAINVTKNVGDIYTLPTTVTTTLYDGTTKNLAVTWDKVASTTVAGTYTFIGKLTMVDGVVNTNNINVSATLTISSASDISDNTDITSKFTDENFRNAVYTLIGKTSPEPILYLDVKNIKELRISYKNISNLSGIEYFIALTDLDCKGNQLTTLDVSKNTALYTLHCEDNQLTTLDVSKNIVLYTLHCDNNQLTTLDVSEDTALTFLWCYDNQLKTLDTNNIALTHLACSSNQLTTLDVSKNTALTDLSCYNNKLTTLDVSKNIVLDELLCLHNQLTTLDVSKNIVLDELACDNNQLTTLDVSKNTALDTLDCASNQLTTLDVSKNTVLTLLGCEDNQLTTLDVSKNTVLKGLYCYNNKLTTLDVSKNIVLVNLSCFKNQLKTLYSIKNTWAISDYATQYIDTTDTTTTDSLVVTIKK
ncbi:Ig-like domain-containing protein [Clostridium estertheticum]|uniref:Ig-like domain-containing protein n=1 Tax=Clostridium estertheticum TaxID=238834 RepID=UPI001C6DE825|nr:Ig-like domain-containing protein [Clostridium estertheticum]MBW9170792.1 Ig-like domain-containing protein [Clostridium estertheticum]WLC74369.1 Ig-like domain-containing protein [Clostridium estertheticum]